MPERSRVPCVVTIHDCTFFDHPEWHVRSKALLFRRAIRHACLHAARPRLRERGHGRPLAVPVCDVRAPIVVAPHGVDHGRFTPVSRRPVRIAPSSSGSGIPLDRPLVAFVGTLEPRKGVAATGRRLRPRGREHMPTPCWSCAGRSAGVSPRSNGPWPGPGTRERIMRVGYLPDAAVPALLRQAAVVAYPAVEEGFGLPALEALACGAPLITTEGTAMAEMAPGAAVSGAPPAMSRRWPTRWGWPSTAAGSARAPSRRALGLAVAAGYTWDASVARHVEAYRVGARTPRSRVRQCAR